MQDILQAIQALILVGTVMATAKFIILMVAQIELDVARWSNFQSFDLRLCNLAEYNWLKCSTHVRMRGTESIETVKNGSQNGHKILQCDLQIRLWNN